MNAPTAPAPSSPSRGVLRLLMLALLCALLQALLPGYTLGPAAVAPLSVVLGVAVAAAAARGLWLVPAAMLGAGAADLLVHGLTPGAAAVQAVVLGAQAALAAALLRPAADPELLLLDSWPRIKRLALVAAPLAAALGAVLGVLAAWVDPVASALPWLRPQLAASAGRFVADAAGIIIAAPVLLCWLGQPAEAWRPRRRLVALPLGLLVLGMLPGFHQVATRDEIRLAVRFDREGSLRRVRVQQLLAAPLDAVLTLRGVLAVDSNPQGMPLFNQLSTGWMARIAGLQATGWLTHVPPAAGGRGETLLRHTHLNKPDTVALPEARTGAEGRLVLGDRLAQALAQAVAEPAQPILLPDADPASTRLLVLQAVPPPSATAPVPVVFARVDAGALLAPALPDDDDPNLRVCLTDRAGGETAAPHRLAGPPRCEADALAQAVRVLTYPLNLGRQRLDLVVSEPPTADNRLFTAVWMLALPAVTGAALLSTLLLALSGRLRRIEDRVRERTAALRAEVDERRQAESRLAVSEQRFRAIFESVNIGVTVVDPAGLIVEVNPAFCLMMGCQPADLLQRPLADFRLPDVAEDDGTAAAMGGGQARRQRYITPDGRVLQVAASLRTLHDAQGRPVATVGALQDLTQVLRLREAEREREQAETASRTKSDFLARLSHELRAPLNAILGFAQMLGRDDLAGSADPAQQQHGLAQIRQAGWHLMDMINDVLDLSRMEAGSLRLRLEPVSLPEVAQEAIAMVQPAAQQAQVSLQLSLSPQAEWVQADTVRLRQVLINLLGNAVKYNRPGGQVMLRARPGGLGEVSIEVEDTGIGMSPEQIGELFTPFHRLGRERQGTPGQPGSQGTGIGLVICRKLTELMGGQIDVSSEEGSGSVFGLRLPRPAGEPVRQVVHVNTPLVPQVTIGTVLYIEDNTADTEAMRRLLAQRPGITLVCAATADEGLGLAQDADLVLLDLDLPDRPGLEVLRALRADSRWRSLQVIVVSAESRPQRIDECFDAGASQFLTKPLDARQTLRVIDDALNA